MLLEEFEKKTNIFVPGEYFDLIHQFYMNTEMDKDQFCKGSRVVSKRKEVLWGFFFLISHQILRLYLVFFQEPVIGRPADLHNFHDVLHGSVMAGQIAGLVKDSRSCKEIIEGICREMKNVVLSQAENIGR